MANKLEVQKRTSGGKGPARRLRAAGQFPAVIYGHGKANIDIVVDAHGFKKFLDTLRSEAELIGLDIAGESGEKLALIKQIQYHPVSEKILHVDLFEINPNEQIHVAVPLHFVGVPIGVSEQGGMSEFLQRDLPIVCLPRDIPSRIDIDISALEAGTALHVSELNLPAGVVTREDPRKALVHVTMKIQHEEVAATAETAEPAATPA
jgi:large subunit ribosomal protein L25